MTSPAAPRVLAIGLDAAESTLIRRMIDANELPVLKGLLDAGSWTRLTSPTRYSSGSVWPNFFTGQRACEHGHYAMWNWDPKAMAMAYTDSDRLVPFWRSLDADGVTVGVVDVPFSPFLGLQKGFELHEWGAHSRIDGRPSVSPPSVAAETARHPKHPFDDDLARPPVEPAEVGAFLDECIAGVTLRGELTARLLTQARPDLAIVVFEEAHHAGHFLWHTIEPDLPMYADIEPADRPERSLADLYQEMDRQVGRLVEAAGSDTTVFVFAVHGMEPSRGLSEALEPLLEHLGLAHIATDVDRRRSALATLKSRLPDPLRRLYHRTVPLSRRSQWGKAALLPSYDWSRTRAFALPFEQHGNIRINLVGREAQGIVPPEEYDELCDSIEAAVRALTTADGRPVVKDVVRPPRQPHPAGLPDLVVHWGTASFESPARLDGAEIPNGRRMQTGQHAPDGFCIVSGQAAADMPETLAGRDLHQLLLKVLGR